LEPLRALRPLVALPLAYRNRVLRAAAAEIDRFIAPSAFLREQYARQGFPAEKIAVLENGMDLRRLAGEALPAPEVRPHFGFLGSLAWQKGVHILIEAFNRLPPDAASLTIFGSDRAFPAYGAELRALARHAQIRFAGALPFDAVGGALRSLDALLMPSLWYENSPLVIQEAYALGVPVIASRLGALEEKVQEGVTGRLFPAGDAAALAEVLGDIVRAPGQLAAFRRNLPPPPDIDSHAAALVGTYEELLARG
jgi:glycosyltransferase involved in cell wall biosynthesis